MDAPGFYTLGDFSLTVAQAYAPTPGQELTGLDGMLSATVELDFVYGSGGGSGVAYVQTSLDQANEGGAVSGTWIDIAAMSFTTASKAKVYNFSALTPVSAVTPTDGAMTPDTQQDGVLGDRLRVKVVTASTAYATLTRLSGRVAVR
jgi:hypothetical protein